MTLVELLSTLRARDINVWADGERLRYSAPSGALTPDIREELAKHKTDVLTFLNETDRVRRATRAPISRISREAKLLPSINQKRLWFIEQLQPNTAFNCYRADRIKGSLNIASLEQSLNEIVRRHEALRSTFSASDGEPFQVITPALKLRIKFTDLRDILDSTERETEAERIITGEVETPFDLAKGPLFRAHLLCLGTDEHLLLLMMHHIVTDAWSMGILVKELTVLYEAFCNGNPSPLPDLPIQYVDFAHWQSQCLQGEVLQQELSYWKERLKGAPEVTELLTDYPRPAVQNFQGASEALTISKSLTEALKTLSKNQGATLFMTLLAALKTLLYRHSGQEDLVLGSPIAGRIRADTENLIGLFINTLVLRTNLSGDPSFRELLTQVREVALDAYAHQEVPFEKLIEDLHLARSLSFTPLFQVMFVLQNTPESELNLFGSTVSPVTIKGGTALFDLFLSLNERDEGLHGALSYRTDLFNRDSISRMVGRFQVLLQGIVADPDRPISTLPLLMETERHQLLVEWNGTNKHCPKDKCLHQLFEEQVERTPDAVAIIFGDQQLTYRELNRRANQLAHHLRKRGVGPEVLVGICVERSLEMAVGLMGILKAGGAYVPLDPHYPMERLAFMLRDSAVSVVLTQQRLLSSFPPHNARIVALDADWSAIAKENEENPDNPITAAHLAYVIYTSGSTGQPKGVLLTQGGVVNHGVAVAQLFALCPEDRVSQCNSLSFDISVEELFSSWISGAAVILYPSEKFLPDETFTQWITREEITVLNLPTAFWQEWVYALESRQKSVSDFLRLIIVGGDKAASNALARWQTLAAPRVRWINTYGPTEATVTTTVYNETLCPVVDDPFKGIPIGRPIAGAQVYILNRNLDPVPISAPGELYIGGAGLARGYLNRSQLTSEKFIANPFSKEPGSRLYRTGDLCRYLPDGNIEFLERNDHQVKIRGFRIEVGEIESVLGQHPGVREAVVLVRENNPGDPSGSLNTSKHLAAYVVPDKEQACTTSELRNFLKQKLPEYMVPVNLVLLDSLPLTVNGKVDRNALPAPDGSRPDVTETFVAPRTATEERLAAIWTKLLGVNRVGTRDNFFDLGGHSLLAVRLFAEIEKIFSKRPPLASLFQQATIEHLAQLLDQKKPSTEPSALVAIQTQGSKRPFFCVHEFFGDVFCYLNLARHLGEDQPFYALQPRGLDATEEPFETAEAMAAYYIDTVRTVQPRGPYALGGLCFGGVIAFEMAQQLRAKGESVRLVALLDSGIGLNYGRIKWWGAFFQNFPRDFHCWLAGSLQLTGAQWLDVIRIKTAAAKGRLGGLFRLPAGVCRADDDLAGLKRLGDVFHFSERHHRVARAQYRALKSYQPQMYTGRLTLFRARMQPFFSSHDPHKGWSRVAAGGVEVKNIPGNHLGMLQEPHVHVLAKELSACLEKANREG